MGSDGDVHVEELRAADQIRPGGKTCVALRLRVDDGRRNGRAVEPLGTEHVIQLAAICCVRRSETQMPCHVPHLGTNPERADNGIITEGGSADGFWCRDSSVLGRSDPHLRCRRDFCLLVVVVLSFWCSFCGFFCFCVVV